MAKDLESALNEAQAQVLEAEKELSATRARNADKIVASKFTISAKEARKTAETTNVYINRIYKAIREDAKEGRTVIYWYRQDVATKLVEDTVATLRENGFDVSFIDRDLRISW